MKIFIKYLFFSIILLSCETKKNGYTITGNIEGIKDSTLIVLYDIDNEIKLDSTYSINGNFIFNGKVKTPITAKIRCENEYSILQLENVDISFKSTFKEMYTNSIVIGGNEQELRNMYQELFFPYYLTYKETIDSLMNEKYGDEENKKKIISRYKSSLNKMDSINVEFGKNNSNSYIGLSFLYMNRKRIAKDTLQSIYENLSPILKNTQTAKILKIHLSENIVEKGKEFIDFKTKTLSGDNFKLSSLKGNYIYLTFWSSGCGACRIKNKFISENFSEIPEYLVMVNFSIDKNFNYWKNASNIDKISWYNLSDLEGGKGIVKTIYQVQATPTSFLINKEGIVIEKYIGYDPDINLIEKLISRINDAK